MKVMFVVCNAGVSPADLEPKCSMAGVDTGATNRFQKNEED